VETSSKEKKPYVRKRRIRGEKPKKQVIWEHHANPKNKKKERQHSGCGGGKERGPTTFLTGKMKRQGGSIQKVEPSLHV